MKITLPSQLRKVSDRALVADLEARMEIVEKRIAEATAHTETLVNKMSSHLSAAGGKRLRPVLTLLTSHLGDPKEEEVLDAAVVMEITHLATLYHDDVMDQATKRRGVDTAHMVWGNNVAILTGDLLFARASNIVSGLGDDSLKLQAKVFEQLVLGQLHETIGPQDGQDPIQHYYEVLRDKTGSLIALSAQIGALVSGAPKEYQEPLKQFGESIGVAFQLIDDIIDIQSTKDQSGKVAGTDLLAGVPTLPVLLLANHKDAESQALFAKISAGLEETDLKDVLGKLRAHQVMAESLEITHGWADRAKASLDPMPASSVKSALIAFADAVVDRQG